MAASNDMAASRPSGAPRFSRRGLISAAGLSSLALAAGSQPSAAVAAATRVAPRAGAGFSVNSGILWETPESRTRSLDWMVAVGATSLRFDLSWFWAEQKSGTFDWSLFDPIIDGARARGLTVLAVLGSAPYWAAAQRTEGQPHNRPASLTTWRRFVRAAATRYKGKVFAYEIWNEPNGKSYFWPAPDPVFFTALVKAAVEEIRAVAPGTLTVCGGLGPGSTAAGDMLAPEFVRRMIAAGIVATKVDHYAFHPYDMDGTLAESARWDLTPVRQVINFAASLRAAGAGSAQIWASEYGYPSVLGVDAQARFLSSGVTQWAEASFAGPMYLHELKDQGPSDTFGVFDTANAPKQAAFAVQWMLQNGIPAREEVVRFDAHPDSALGAAVSPVFAVGATALGRDHVSGTRFETPTGWWSSPVAAGALWRQVALPPSGPFADGMQNGPTGVRVFSNPSTGTWLVLGDILTAWRPAYGFPLGGQYVNAAGTTVQDFQYGTISWKAGLVSGSLGA